MSGSAESEHPRLTNGEIISEYYNLYVITIHQRHRRTDRRTARQTTYAIARSRLSTKVHRAVKTKTNWSEETTKPRPRLPPIFYNLLQKIATPKRLVRWKLKSWKFALTVARLSMLTQLQQCCNTIMKDVGLSMVVWTCVASSHASCYIVVYLRLRRDVEVTWYA